MADLGEPVIVEAMYQDATTARLAYGQRPTKSLVGLRATLTKAEYLDDRNTFWLETLVAGLAPSFTCTITVVP